MDNLHQEQITGIRNGDLIVFEKLYNQYYVYLCLIAEHIMKNQCDAEEIVQDVFVKLWNIREKINITTSIKAYLVRAVRNTSINYLERQGISNRLTDTINDSDCKLAWDSDYPLGQLYEKEILDILDHGISKLPDGCREIFRLSRNEEMKYNEIAENLGISVNTVKTQMKIALVRLRLSLKDYLLIFFLLIIN